MILATILAIVSCKPEHTHTATGELVVVKNATCGEDGQAYMFCIDCGAIVESVSIPKTNDHTEIVLPAVDATCENAGLTEGKQCSKCYEIIVPQYATPLKEHIEELIPAIESSCSEYGLTEGKKCSVCGKTLISQQKAPLKPHVEVVDKAVDATCAKTGLTEGKHCSVCKGIIVFQQEIPVIAHTYDDKYDEICNVCGFVRDAECAHRESETIKGYEATCTSTGLSDGEKCKKCGEILVIQVVTPLKEHTEIVDEAVQETCATIGLTEGRHCSVCGTITLEQKVISPLGHTWGNATCTEPKTCTVCGETEGNALGHRWVDATCTEPQTCSVCGETEGNALGHKWDDETDIHPKTCTVCGVNICDAIGHSWNDATCTEPQTCSECGIIEGSALGHNIENGVCTRCGIIAITNATELKKISSNLGGEYILLNDINLNGAEWTPIGDSTKPFTGTFVGNGYVISNLTITGDVQYAGLFGYNNGTIENLGVENCSIDVSYYGVSYTGGLVGYNNLGTIVNCYTSGEVSVDVTRSTTEDNGRVVIKEYSGGLVGYNKGIIHESYSNSNVTVLLHASASSSVGSGESYTYAYAGGLIGYSCSENLVNCYATGNVRAECVAWATAETGCTRTLFGRGYVGGLLGYGESISLIENCYATGTVFSNIDAFNAESYAGGLIGMMANNATITRGECKNCYALRSVYSGVVSGSNNYSYTGGLIAHNTDMDISNCNSRGNVQGGSSAHSYAGGLIGYNKYSSIEDSYATGDVLTVNFGTSYNGGYTYAGGLIGSHQSSKRPISNCYATGEVVGQVYYGFESKVAKSYVFVGGFAGLSDGTITNSYSFGNVEGISESIGRLYSNDPANMLRVGGFIGSASGTITNCYAQGNATGSVKGKDCENALNSYVGGFVGYNHATIDDSYAIGNVSSTMTGYWYKKNTYAGGFVGYSKGNINNSYAGGNITSVITDSYNDSYHYVGGFAGDCTSDLLNNCYRNAKQEFYVESPNEVTYTATNDYGIPTENTIIQ